MDDCLARLNDVIEHDLWVLCCDEADPATLVRTANPAGWIAEPEEVADTVVYLASDAASYVTGTTLRVDGR